MFHVFRKNQRTWMAVLGVLIMISFTLSAVPNFLADRGAGQDPLLATSRYGEYRSSTVQMLVGQRNIVKQFLYQAMIQARLQEWVDSMQKQFGGDLKNLLSPQMLQGIEGRIGNELAFELSQSIGPSNERGVVETNLQAKLADREGIVITDDAITEYLRLQTGDRVTGEQMKTILNQINSGGRHRITRGYLYDALRTELAAAKYRQFFLMGMQSTPAERWEYYARLKRRATVELVGLSAADLLSQVPEPSERELLAFFDAHKQQLPQPGSPKPGFRVPQKAAFDYLRADYDKFYDEASVEEKDIVEEYEKNKDAKYRYSSLAAESEEDDTDTDEQPTNPTENQRPDEKQADKPKDAGDKKPGDKKDAEQGAAPKSAETKGDDKPTPPKSDEPQGKEEQAGGKQTSGDRDKSEGGSSDGGFADEVPATDTAKPAEQQAASGDKPAENAQQSEKKSDEKQPADDKPVSETTAGGDKKDDKQTADDKADKKSETPAAGTPDLKAPDNAPPDATPKASPPPLLDRYELPDDIKSGKTPKYAPLWKVRDRIRKDLAAARAVAKMEAAIEKVRPQLTRYSEQRANAEFQQQTPPPAPDFATLAKANGLTSGKIPLSSAYEVGQEAGLGESTVGSERFTVFAYGSLKAYTPATSQDSAGNRYLFWKTADIEAHVPELAEVRSEVLRTWKMVRARDLMLRKADELAAKARSAAKPLKESLEGYKAVDAGPFSWLTTGSAGDFNGMMEPEISSVEGVVDPGPEFMQKVFDLRVGDVGVAMNNPETAAYVVRVTSLEPSESVLRDTFLADKGGTPQQVAQASRYDQGKIVDAWREKFEADTRLVWVQPPSDDVSDR
ncbi:MAG TPA: hypothetical protein VG713_21345 [Pirellulales bacterium]|nr:hypothetical protein [Pirellulales bacterium]